MISYYDLLELVKNKKQPEEIDVKICSYTRRYEAEYDGDEFSHYYISDDSYPDENYHNYLADSFLESNMFDRCITIVEEKPKKIEYVQHSSNDSQNVKKIKSKIDELVDVVNYLLEKESDK